MQQTKFPRISHVDFSPGTTSDDRIADDLSGVIGVEIVMTEKLDGENRGITNEGCYARSHVDFTTSRWSNYSRTVLWPRIKDWIADDVCLFGEDLEAIHSIEYSELTDYFYLFGIRDKTTWQSWDAVELVATLLEVPTAPVLFRGVVNSEEELKQIVVDLVSKPSKLGSNIMEGVVIRPTAEFEDDSFSKSVFKWVRKDHVQTTEHWTRNWRKAKLHYNN
jgi:hypothetical protein